MRRLAGSAKEREHEETLSFDFLAVERRHLFLLGQLLPRLSFSVFRPLPGSREFWRVLA